MNCTQKSVLKGKRGLHWFHADFKVLMCFVLQVITPVTPDRAPALTSVSCQRSVPGSTPVPVRLVGLSPLTSSHALEVWETSAKYLWPILISRAEFLMVKGPLPQKQLRASHPWQHTIYKIIALKFKSVELLKNESGELLEFFVVCNQGAFAWDA